VYWNNRASAVLVLQEMMAAFFTHYLETEFSKCSDEVAAGY
jgi:hypothetical protein